MAHPLHEILRRLLDSEQFAFDANTKEYWPSETWQHAVEEPGNDESASRHPG